MSKDRLLPDLFARLGPILAAMGAALFACAVLIAAPPAATAQDDPATEDAAPAETAPEDAAQEDATPDAAPEEDAAPAEAAPPAATTEEPAIEEEAAPAATTEEPATEEEAAPEESKPWDVSKPCDNYQHPYQADLCQQWRTAQAAEQTAVATARTAGLSRLLMLIGAIAILLLLLMFVPLVLAALAARKAARGERAASPPAALEEEREDEVRAYLDVDKLEFIETPESEGIVKVKVTFRNTGQTPAFKTRSATKVGIRDVSNEELIPVMPLPDRALNSARPRLGHDATTVDIVQCDSTPSLADRVMNGDATIVVWGWAEYLDVFAKRRRTAFQYLCNADSLDTGQIFKPMIRGDEEG